MTFSELNILQEVEELKRVDRDQAAHWQAFLNFQVTGTKKKGQPVYKNFRKFFDYEKELEKVSGRKEETGERITEIGKILYGGG